MNPSIIPPPPTDPTAPRYPFDPISRALHSLPQEPNLDSDPSLRDRLQLHLRTLSPLKSPQSILLFSTIFLFVSHLISLTIFTKGFLLSREELNIENDCQPFLNSSTISSKPILDASCSISPTHSKALILIIDALRSDFIFPIPSSSSSSSSSPPPNPYYHNQIPLPSHLTSTRPLHSFLSHFIADPPTTTLQRIKGLTTGSLPTFIDLGSNFAGEVIGEDNWLKRAKKLGRKVALVGDDTWLKVFPSGGEGVWEEGLTFPYDSFNVEDLDTVDRGVRTKVLELLEPNKTSTWDILIAHGLGLDHSGHRYGPSHSETRRKLQETQSLLEEIIDRLEEDTLFILMGDHGMTSEGDHGGDSFLELDSVIWFYSKSTPLLSSTFFEESSNPLKTLFSTNTEGFNLADRPFVNGMERSVNQVDFVPTFSLLMGWSIPFGNLGVVIPELFWRESKVPKVVKGDGIGEKKFVQKKSLFGRGGETEVEMEILTPLETLLQATLLTSSQLSKYLNFYSTTSKDFLPYLPELTFHLSLAKSHYLSSFVPNNDKIAMELKALEKFTLFSRKTRDKAREFWAKFDLGRIGLGLMVGLGSVLVGLKVVVAAKNGMRARFILARGVEGTLTTIWGLVITWLLWVWEWGPFKSLKNPIVTAGIIALGSQFAILATEHSPIARHGTFGFGPFSTPKDLLPLLPLLSHSLFFASNSFIVYENRSIGYILSTLLFISFLKSFAAPEKRLRNRLAGFSFVALILVRIMSSSTVCREEQGPDCVNTFGVVAGSTFALGKVGIAGVLGWFLPTALRASLALSASDTALAPAYLGWGVRFFLLVGVAYWTIDWMIAGVDLAETGKQTAMVVKTGLARVVLVGAPLTSSLVWYYSPLCLRVQRETIVDEGGATRTQIKFIGFANTFGASYLLFLSSAFALLWLVNPPQGQIVLGLHFGVLLCLLEIFDTERDVAFLRNTFSTASIEQLLNNETPKPPSHTGPTLFQISILASLAHLSFFATGHQAALSSIQWSTAFIGFTTVVYPFSPLLVILNTLSPFILTALAIPLFAFWNLSPTLKDQPSLPLIRTLIKISATYSTYQFFISLSSAFWAAYFRRHLMVWKVFAPRFMLGVIEALVTDVFLVVAMGVAVVTIGKAKATLGTKVSE